MSKVFITGATGFIGAKLTHRLADSGHEAVVLTRDASSAEGAPEGSEIVVGDPGKPGAWQEKVAQCDAAVNLAGAPIVGRWTPKFKDALRDSRVLSTRNLVDAIPAGKPFTLFSASAVGIYGDGGDVLLGEDSPHGSDFLAKVAEEWEAEAMRAKDKGARVIVGRFGLVLGRNGGALEEMFRNAKSYATNVIGDGGQWVSWVHIEDLVAAIIALLDDPGAEGVFNIAAPEPVRQRDLAHFVRERLRTRAAFNVPKFIMRTVLGDFFDNLHYGQRMDVARLLGRGFSFTHTDVRQTVRKLL